MVQRHKRATVNAKGCGFDSFFFHFPYSGNQAKRVDEFRRSTRNASTSSTLENSTKSVLIRKECLNTRFPNSLSLACSVRYTP